MRKGNKTPLYIRKKISKNHADVSGKNNPMYGVKKYGKDNPHWKGGRVVLLGYVYLYHPKHPHCDKRGYIAEYRLIVENCIGRLLKPEEKVHHINGIKTDNRIENLVLCPNEAYHKKFFHKRKRNKQGRFTKKG